MAEGAPEGREELTGLEWEAEKAYIIATSPRSVFYISNSQCGPDSDADDFSWDTVASIKEVSTTELAPTQETISQLETGVTNQLSHNEEPLEVPRTDESISLSQPERPLPLKVKPSNNLIIYGPSGIGKSNMVKKLVYRSPQKFALVISHTTRLPHADEMYARDYYFVSRKDMMQKIKQGKFMEYVQIDRPNATTNHRYSYTQQSFPESTRQSFSAITSTSPIITASSSEGDLYGTSWDAFNEAQDSGKHWTVFNVSTKGAEQLKELGIEGHYILMYPCTSTAGSFSNSLQADHVIELRNSDEDYGYLENHVFSLMSESSGGHTKDMNEKPATQLEKVKDEWERVPTVQIGSKRSTKRKKNKQQNSQKTTTFVELLSHFQLSNLSEQLSRIKPEVDSSRITKLFGISRLAKKLKGERDLIFAIALCKFNDQIPLHIRALFTVYKHLSAQKNAVCPRFGPHWEEIGFQGSDPADDLRGVGMLGLLQLVWFLETPVISSAAVEIYRYSKDGPHPIPFCVVSLNVTCMVLQALREGCLTKECNKKEQVFVVFNELYAAIFVSFFHNWKRHCKDVMEQGMILQDVAKFAKKNVHFMIRELEGFLQDREKELQSPSALSGITVEPSVEFSKLEPPS